MPYLSHLMQMQRYHVKFDSSMPESPASDVFLPTPPVKYKVSATWFSIQHPQFKLESWDDATVEVKFER